jgi:hypothetical protein
VSPDNAVNLNVGAEASHFALDAYVDAILATVQKKPEFKVLYKGPRRSKEGPRGMELSYESVRNDVLLHTYYSVFDGNPGQKIFIVVALHTQADTESLRAV